MSPLSGYPKSVAHPKFTASLSVTRRFNRSATIQSRTETYSATGSISYVWSDIAGLEGIPALIAVAETSNEVRTVEDIEQRFYKEILLQGYYPSIDPTMRVVVDGTEIYDIYSTQNDSTQIFTRLQVRETLPEAQPGI